MKDSINLLAQPKIQNIKPFSAKTNRFSRRKYTVGNIAEKQEKIRELTSKLNNLQLMNLNQLDHETESKILSLKIQEKVSNLSESNSWSKHLNIQN